mmetsp:Transcript_129888/g.416810  ORF Transcript_129888/g.416810 Transcript_129888/m.416810 type:complete len:462 (-) Transcript_129888:1112-2497(-)
MVEPWSREAQNPAVASCSTVAAYTPRAKTIHASRRRTCLSFAMMQIARTWVRTAPRASAARAQVFVAMRRTQALRCARRSAKQGRIHWIRILALGAAGRWGAAHLGWPFLAPPPARAAPRAAAARRAERRALRKTRPGLSAGRLALPDLTFSARTPVRGVARPSVPRRLLQLPGWKSSAQRAGRIAAKRGAARQPARSVTRRMLDGLNAWRRATARGLATRSGRERRAHRKSRLPCGRSPAGSGSAARTSARSVARAAAAETQVLSASRRTLVGPHANCLASRARISPMRTGTLGVADLWASRRPCRRCRCPTSAPARRRIAASHSAASSQACAATRRTNSGPSAGRTAASRASRSRANLWATERPRCGSCRRPPFIGRPGWMLCQLGWRCSAQPPGSPAGLRSAVWSEARSATRRMRGMPVAGWIALRANMVGVAGRLGLVLRRRPQPQRQQLRPTPPRR